MSPNGPKIHHSTPLQSLPPSAPHFSLLVSRQIGPMGPYLCMTFTDKHLVSNSPPFHTSLLSVHQVVYFLLSQPHKHVSGESERSERAVNLPEKKQPCSSSHLGIRFTIMINEPKWPKNQPFTAHTQLFGSRLDNRGSWSFYNVDQHQATGLLEKDPS